MESTAVIIVAMESERRHLDTLMPGWEPVESGPWRTLRNNDVVCLVSGIGMIAAAAATEHAISTYNPALILNYGCAGAHVRDLFPGDVVIGDVLVHQGRMRFAEDGSIVPLDIGFTVPGEEEPVTHLASDPTLLRLATETGESTALPAWPREHWLINQHDRAPIVRIGSVSSGDIWFQSADRIDAGHARTGSLCEDMEAASIAQVCAMHRVPFLTVKDISNSEFHTATVFEGTSSALPSGEVGLRSSMIIVGVIERLRLAGLAPDLGYS
jgi:adenosylhomocysteine nucleosidase